MIKKLNVSLNRKGHKKLEDKPIQRHDTIYTEKVINHTAGSARADKGIRKKPGFKLPFKLNKKFLIITLAILFFGGIAAFAYWRIQAYGVRVESFDEQGNKVDKCTNILNPDCWTEAFKPQLKQTDGYTNVLIIGMDTRDGGSSMLTDTIMIVSYNHATNKMMMVSIPRDFFDFWAKAKINAVVPYTFNRDKTDPYKFLKQEVAAVTGKTINYTITVHFDGVINLVNKIGGIDVCPTASFTAQYPNSHVNAKDPAQWHYFDFAKGCQHLDGDMALVYARFRHLRRGPSELASDFSRARRQQEVINGIKDKLLSDNQTLKERTENYWSILQEVNQNITIDLSFEDFLAGLSLIDVADKKPASVVLDPNFGGINKFIYTDSNPSEGYTIKSRDKDYAGIKKELTSIWTNIDFYKDAPNIAVRNQTGDKTLAADNIVFKIKNDNKYYAAFNVYNDAKTDKFTGIKIFDFTAGSKPNSLAVIKKTLGVDNVELLPETYGISQSNKKEDFLIVVGPTTVSDSATPTVAPTK